VAMTLRRHGPRQETQPGRQAQVYPRKIYSGG